MSLGSIILGLLQDLRSHKLRAALTVFGVAWGTVGVIVLLAFGEGMRIQTQQEQHGLGAGIVMAALVGLWGVISLASALISAGPLNVVKSFFTTMIGG